MAKEGPAGTPVQGASREIVLRRLKVLDALIDQANVSAYITLSGLSWMQDLYMYGVRMMAETGRAIEDGCRIKIPLREEAAGFVEKTASTLLKVQRGLLKTSIRSTMTAAELLRDRLAESEPAERAASPVHQEEGAADKTPLPRTGIAPRKRRPGNGK